MRFSRLCFMLFSLSIHIFPFYTLFYVKKNYIFGKLPSFLMVENRIKHFVISCTFLFAFIIWWNNAKAFATLYIASFPPCTAWAAKEGRRRFKAGKHYRLHHKMSHNFVLNLIYLCGDYLENYFLMKKSFFLL